MTPSLDVLNKPHSWTHFSGNSTLSTPFQSYFNVRHLSSSSLRDCFDFGRSYISHHHSSPCPGNYCEDANDWLSVQIPLRCWHSLSSKWSHVLFPWPYFPSQCLLVSTLWHHVAELFVYYQGPLREQRLWFIRGQFYVLFISFSLPCRTPWHRIVQ